MLLKDQNDHSWGIDKGDRVNRPTGTYTDGNARRDLEGGKIDSENSAAIHQVTKSSISASPVETELVNGRPHAYTPLLEIHHNTYTD